MLVFLLIIIIILVYLYYYQNYNNTVELYSKCLKHPKYFFMEPKLFFIFMNIYDIRHYSKKAYFEAIKHCDIFCNTLFLLNLDDSWNDIVSDYSNKTPETQMEMFKIKSHFDKLKEKRLDTINTLETMFITILPNPVLTEKLKNTILELNEFLLMTTQKEYQKKGLYYTEFKPEAYDAKQIQTFFIN